MTHSLFRVSCKIALYNPSRTKVLVACYKPGKYGLIGGHMDAGEQPDEAMLREIREEIGIDYMGRLEKVGFEVVNKRADEKVCLEYCGELAENIEFVVDTAEMQSVEWVAIQDIQNYVVQLNDYKEFVIAHSRVA